MTKQPKTLDDLFHDTLKDIYFAEKKIVATLPKMAKSAQHPQLKVAFEKHLKEKADAAIVKAGDTKEVRLSLGKLLGGQK